MAADPYCLITHLWEGHIRMMDIPESAIPWALKHGWSVLAKDSDIPGWEHTGGVVFQSNPRRMRFKYPESTEGD